MQRSVAYVAVREMKATERRDTRKNGKCTAERLKAWDRFNAMLEQHCGKKKDVVPLGLVPAIQR